MASLIVLHGCRTIQLTRGKSTLVDEADFARFGRLRWCACTSDGRRFYAKRRAYLGGWPKAPTYRDESLHRQILNPTPGQYVDHRNGDSLDNTRSNLRIATPAQNMRNVRRARGRSRFKGVSANRRGWRALIGVNRQILQLGTFPTEEEAARAYDAAARLHHGEFAATNADLGLYGEP